MFPRATMQKCGKNITVVSRIADMNTVFKTVFLDLKKIMMVYFHSLIVVEDEVDNLYLNTRYIMKNKKPLYFGGVKIGKSYVSYHLMPIYVFPELLDNISPELKKRMQGKSCFNFKKTEKDLLEELGILTKCEFEKYQEAGYID